MTTTTAPRVILWADTDDTTHPASIPGLAYCGSSYPGVYGLTAGDGSTPITLLDAARRLHVGMRTLQDVAARLGVDLAADGSGTLNR